MQEYPVKLLREMLETYSPSGSEETIARMLKGELSSLGFGSHVDRIGNVIAEAGDSGPEIMFCGHMDTVPGEIPVRLEGGFLYGRGAVDAKSSLAAMIVAASQFVKETKAKVRVKLVCVVQEETSSIGFREFLSTTKPLGMVVFGEPSRDTNIIVAYKGRIGLEVECATRGGHAASPWLSKNSAEEAYGFWTSLRREVLFNESETKFSSTTGSLTGINTAGPGNSIPARTVLTIDVRLPPAIDPAQILARIQESAYSYCDAHPGVRLAISTVEQLRGRQSDSASPLVSIYRRAIRSVIGTTPTFLSKTGSSDMNLLNSRIPAIAYGPGDSKLDHTDNERVSIREYLNSIDVHSYALRLFSQQGPAITVPS
ncbi:MAG TPA: M20/M25/M40 family metallo-hydrolase [Candidatus Bathyarchaeia archaeon]|nr:M20/M25/M40 family metallo-hydrolase [Candidatus Bathyarchaeia archaeon]